MAGTVQGEPDPQKPVYVVLTCYICGSTEMARPKKWWPDFTYMSCETHSPDELPDPAAGSIRGVYVSIGTHFVGAFVDAKVSRRTR